MIQPSTTFPTPSSPLPPTRAPAAGQGSPPGLIRLTADHMGHESSKGLSVPREPRSLKYRHQHSMPSSSKMSSSLCRILHVPQDHQSPASQFPIPTPESWLRWLAKQTQPLPGSHPLRGRLSRVPQPYHVSSLRMRCRPTEVLGGLKATQQVGGRARNTYPLTQEVSEPPSGRPDPAQHL